MDNKKGMSSGAKVAITIGAIVAVIAGGMFMASQMSGDGGGGSIHERFQKQHQAE